MTSTAPASEQNKRKLVMLTVTESCNLHCLYCYETAKTNTSMDLGVAKEVIDHEFSHSKGFDEIEFDLFGGEPTICKDFIIDLVEWTIAKNYRKPFLFFLQTNGTLVHGAFQDWLLKNKTHVHVGLSLDGTPESHNHNRSGSYDRIDVDFFVKHYQKQGVRMTVNSDTVGNLFNDIVHLHKLGFERVDAFFAYGIAWEVKDVRDQLALELRKLCDFYLENPHVRECSLFDMHLPRLLDNRKRPKLTVLTSEGENRCPLIGFVDT